MTIGTDQSSMTPQSGSSMGQSTESSKPKEMATTAQQQGTEVAQTAKEAAGNVAHEAASQASAVASEAKNQMHTMVHQARGELRDQMNNRGQQAAEGLMTLSRQISALAEGRREEAGRVGVIVDDAQQRLQSYAERLQARGPQALVDDVTSFARRRPGMFLMGAVATGFMVGRIVRAGAAANKEQQNGNGMSRDGWQGSWQPPATQSAMVPGSGYSTGMQSGASGTGLSGMTGPAEPAWPATGPTGMSTEGEYGLETP